FRISSWEPEGVDEDFLEVFAHPRIRPHLHLPIQSGSDELLRSMGRAYRRDKVISSCEALRRVKGDLFIAADLMAGYPGESEDDFAATVDLARRCDLAWIHAFPFSPRPGTRAWDLSPQVGARDREARVTELRALAWLGRRKYLGRQSGSLVEAVLEAGARVEGRSRATSSNYLRLLVEDLPAQALRGRGILCRLAGEVISSSNVLIKTSLDELGEVDSVASFVSMVETGG
ncbi:MAG: radical SAM protein, partial [Spirochaetota bacterium]